MYIRQSHSIVLFALLVCFLLSLSSYAQENLFLKNLRVEYKKDPIGIDDLRPRLSWEIISDRQNTMQNGFEIKFADSKENLVKGNLNYKMKKQTSQSIHVEYDGPELSSRQRVYWQVKIKDNHGRESAWSEIAFWEMGFRRNEDWKATWIKADLVEDSSQSNPAHYLRNEFETKERINKARLYITSHGLYQAYINGERVGDQELTPGWTSYNKRLQYQIYDVTNNIKKGSNAIGVILGDGWYRGNLGWKNNRNVYGKELALLAQLEIEYANGELEIICTDESWKAVNNGAILCSDIYNGENYDARKEFKGWTLKGYDSSDWGNVKIVEHSKEKLITTEGPAVKKIQEIKPIGIIKKSDNKYIFDMGQNMVGWIRLKVNGQAGTTVKLRHAEVLDKHGEFYTENLRSAKQEINYTLNGKDKEVFEPHFTFQGFRYVEVTDFPGTPSKENITGIVVHSDMPLSGTFSCSDSLINQLQHNILWGLKGNFVDVPTDCPQRDERLGWTGDAQVFASTACFNVDAAMFYTKWLKDLSADQGSDGKVGDVIPNVLKGGGGHTGWADAAIIIPYTVYKNYGDKKILSEQYKSMKAWVGYMQKHAGDDYIWNGDWHYGDWLSFDDDSPAYMGAYTETDLIATAYYAYSTMLFSKIADIIGRNDDSQKYRNLFENIREAFITEFVTPNGRLVSNTQTAYTLALAFDLLDGELKLNAAKNLSENVKRFKHITTGFLGTPLINKTLSENGYLDLAYLLLNRKEYPSWLYPVTMGATTIWERWDGQKPDSTFQNKGMNSFNHYAYGAIGDWLYSTVAGINIDPKNPGYKNIIFAPKPGGSLENASATLQTMYGKVVSEWQIENGVFIYDVSIPPNTTAEFMVEVKYIESLKLFEGTNTEIDFELKECENSKFKKIILGSGSYRFTHGV